MNANMHFNVSNSHLSLSFCLLAFFFFFFAFFSGLSVAALFVN